MPFLEGLIFLGIRGLGWVIHFQIILNTIYRLLTID